MSLPPTERPHPDHPDLDAYPTDRLVEALAADQAAAAEAVRRAGPDLARAVDGAAPRLARGGRLIYVGAGTSGRLGLLDSVELHPTFSWPRDRSLALLAGGPEAVREAAEGAEDDREQGGRDLLALNPGPDDVVLLLAASGGTPYTLGALAAARAAGAFTVGLANNPGSALAAEAEVGVTLDTGPEMVSGSTRLKAGTAQKIALNTFSTAVMVRLHKVHGNLMVDVRATNAKLVRRAVRLTALAAGVDEDAARAAFEACGRQVKPAIVALRLGVGPEEAQLRLEAAGGSVRAALRP